MADELDEVLLGVEAALRRAVEGVRRQAQASGHSVVWCRNGKVQRVRIEPDGSETVLEERLVRR